jgi:hypothetical protein
LSGCAHQIRYASDTGELAAIIDSGGMAVAAGGTRRVRFDYGLLGAAEPA